MQTIFMQRFCQDRPVSRGVREQGGIAAPTLRAASAHDRLARGISSRIVNFDDQDWEVGQAPAAEARVMSTAWKVAAGVVVGMVLGGVLIYGVDRLQAPVADATVAGPPIERLIQAEPPAASSPMKQPAAEPRASLQLLDPDWHLPRTVVLSPSEATTAMDREKEAEAAQRAAQRAAERKEKAWAEFYQKPALCDENPTRAIMVECANQYIRARHEFEETYSAGKR
jgi:hypothetical protein